MTGTIIGAFAQEPTASPGVLQAAAADPVRVRTISGESSGGSLKELRADLVRLGDREVRTTDLLRLFFPLHKAKPARSLVVLTNDDVIALTVREINEESFEGERADGSKVAIPLEFVKGWLVGLPETQAARRASWRLLRRKSDIKEDTVSLKSGDSLVGELLGLSDDRLQIETSAGARSVATGEVAGIRLNPDLLSPIRQGGAATIQTTHRETLTAAKLTPELDGELRVTTVWGADVTIPMSAITAIDWNHASLVRLSSVAPQQAVVQPYLGKKTAIVWRRNQSITGKPLTHKSERFAHGIGTTSRSEIVWSLEGMNGAAFHTQFGIDDAGATGTAIFRVLVDGKEHFSSGPVRSGQAVRTTPAIPVGDAKTLSLIVEFGPRGDIHDFANWLNPVVVRK